MSALQDLNEKLIRIAAQYSTDGEKISVSYSIDARLYIDGSDCKKVLEEMGAHADEIRAELPGRKLSVVKQGICQVWSTHDRSGYPTGKRAGIRVSMTEEELDGVRAGEAVGLKREEIQARRK